jgi:2,4-diaminopentanoate dehydrogenase
VPRITMQGMTPLRIVQWSTGNVGGHSLRTVVEHPELELVGVYTHSPAKAGHDAGELCGLPRTGVAATSDVAEIVALKADCVLYMPAQVEPDDLVALLGAGTNVVTTLGDFQNPAFVEPALRARVEEACAAGGTSLFSTGSSPGFVTDALPFALAGLVRDIDLLQVDEYSDVSSRDSPEMLFGTMGFGLRPAESTAEQLAGYLVHSRERSFHLLAEAFGLRVDGMRAGAETALTRRRTEIAAGVVEAGTVGGLRLTVDGLCDGEPLLRFRANWYLTPDLETPDGACWDLLHAGWRVAVRGRTPLDVVITFPVPEEEYAAFSPGLTAHPAVNAVPYVVAARPGILRSLDLPHLLPRLTR